MRRDELFLVDMFDAARAVGAFLSGIDEDSFRDSDLLQSAVLQKLMVVGEAAGRVSKEVQDRWPDVQWRSISGFRNLAVHAYFEIDWSIVWRIATVSLPVLLEQLTALVKTDFPLIAGQLGPTD